MYVGIIHTVNFLDLSMRNLLIFIVSSFSSPGAGKSTISEEAIRLLRNHDELSKYHVLHLDLDVCVPQWMRVSGLKQPMQHTICRKESMNTYTGFLISQTQNLHIFSPICCVNNRKTSLKECTPHYNNGLTLW